MVNMLSQQQQSCFIDDVSVFMINDKEQILRHHFMNYAFIVDVNSSQIFHNSKASNP